MIDYFVFDDIDSRDYGAYVYFRSIDDSPARSYTSKTIAGRNGDLYIDTQRYPNVSMLYTVIVMSENEMESLKNDLLSKKGYALLSDSFHPEEQYISIITRNITPNTLKDRTIFKAQIEFNRKPERYLLSGNTIHTFTASDMINNPTPYDSKPLIRIYGTGTLGVGTYEITVNESDDYVDIDCSLMEAYRGLESKNQYIELSNNVFPVLHTGYNGITMGEGITKVEITPKWYIL